MSDRYERLETDDWHCRYFICPYCKKEFFSKYMWKEKYLNYALFANKLLCPNCHSLFGKDECYSKKLWEMKRKRSKVKEFVARHFLDLFIKQGYSNEGTDMEIECSDLFGAYWWPEVRNRVLERDMNKCQMCGASETFIERSYTYGNGARATWKQNVPLEVHHIIHRENGGADNPINLITLCQKCHDYMHRGTEVRKAEERIAKCKRLDEFLDLTVTAVDE